MRGPLAIDLFCGLGGWTEALLDEGYHVVGFDIERHVYGEHRYPGDLVIQDVLTLHGSQFKGAALIVASPPCQEYSYMAMPWTRAKAKSAAIRADGSGESMLRLNRLFDACFRIQREASEAAGHRVPMVVENVRGAQPWVGRARWNFGSFYLWGDVPALMPIPVNNRLKGGQTNWRDHEKPGYVGDQLQDHFKSSGMNWNDRERRGQDFTMVAGDQALKNPGFRFDGSGRSFQSESVKNTGGSWFNVAHNTTSGKGQNPDGRKLPSYGGRRTDVGNGVRMTSRDWAGGFSSRCCNASRERIRTAAARAVRERRGPLNWADSRMRGDGMGHLTELKVRCLGRCSVHDAAPEQMEAFLSDRPLPPCSHCGKGAIIVSASVSDLPKPGRTSAQKAWNIHKLTGIRWPISRRFEPRPWYRRTLFGIGVRADLNWKRWVVGFDWYRHWRRAPLVLRLYLGPVVADLEFSGRYYDR